MYVSWLFYWAENQIFCPIKKKNRNASERKYVAERPAAGEESCKARFYGRKLDILLNKKEKSHCAGKQIFEFGGISRDGQHILR